MISTSEQVIEYILGTLVESSASTGEEISSLTMKIVEEIDECGVNIVSYATDNCPTMKATEKLLRMSGRCLKQVLCGAYILNGVFKDFINSRGSKPIWDNVGVLR